MLRKRTVLGLTTALLAIAGTNYSTAGPIHYFDQDKSNLTPLSAELEADLKFMREEEKLARDSYLEFGGQWGLTIFDNISVSEQKHMNAIEVLLDKYNVDDPVEDESNIGSFDNDGLQALFDKLEAWGMTSVMDSLQVGGLIEEVDMTDIQDAIDQALAEDPVHVDIVTTYESLMCGSRNHLRAFVGQIESNGGDYEPKFLSQAQLEAIVDSPKERDCGGNHRGNGNGHNGDGGNDNDNDNGKGKGKGNKHGDDN